MNQRQGVYMAVVAVLGTNHGKVEWDELPKQKKQEIFDLLEDEFMAGNIELRDRESKDRNWIKKYIPGLVNNWVRKDDRLNGGGKYEAKNPGSRTGSGDESLRAMKILLEQTDDPKAKADIQNAIELRKAELAPKPKELKVEALPEHLRKYAPLGVTVRKAH